MKDRAFDEKVRLQLLKRTYIAIVKVLSKQLETKINEMRKVY